MQNLILTLHLIVCFLLVVLILLQSGKEGMGVIFGGGNSSVFGSTGAGGILAKLTTLMAIIFVITSLSYTYVTSTRPESESVILNVQIEDRPKAQDQAVQPANPAPEKAVPESAPNPAPAESAPASAESSPATTSPDGEKPEAGAPATSEPEASTQDSGREVK